MEAPEESKSVCAQCLRHVARPVTDCDELLCPMEGDSELGVGEAAFSAELARVNLLRMRGEHAAARSACLSILKRLPGSVTAHTLMGDIHADQDDLPAALEWYDMALELDPTSRALEDKKHTVQHRIQDREAAETIQHLGIPTAKPQVKAFVWATVVFVAAIGATGFLAGRALKNNRPAAAYEQPIQVNLTSPPTESSSRESATPINNETPETRVAIGLSVDNEVLARLQKEFKDGDRWIAATVANRRAILTATLKETEDAEETAKQLATAAAGILKDMASVSVRVVRNGSTVAAADWPQETVAKPVPPPDTSVDNKGTDTDTAPKSEPEAPNSGSTQ